MKTAPGIDERYRPATDTEIVLQFATRAPTRWAAAGSIAHRLDFGPLGAYGHRAQAFHTSLEKFTAQRRGMTVRVQDGAG